MGSVRQRLEAGFAVADVLAAQVVGGVGAGEVGVLGGDPVVRAFEGGDGGGGGELVFVRFVDLVGQGLDGEGGFGDEGRFGAGGGVEGEEFVVEGGEFGTFGAEVGLGCVVGVLLGGGWLAWCCLGVFGEGGRTLTWAWSFCRASISLA